LKKNEYNVEFNILNKIHQSLSKSVTIPGSALYSSGMSYHGAGCSYGN